jgi:ubiquinone biosynthesis protein
LAPEVNMWSLAQPLIEEWMRTNRGPEARLYDALAEAGKLVERLPKLVRTLERAARQASQTGLRLDPESIDRLVRRAERASHPLTLPLWLTVAALIAIAIAMWS